MQKGPYGAADDQSRRNCATGGDRRHLVAAHRGSGQPEQRRGPRRVALPDKHDATGITATNIRAKPLRRTAPSGPRSYSASKLHSAATGRTFVNNACVIKPATALGQRVSGNKIDVEDVD